MFEGASLDPALDPGDVLPSPHIAASTARVARPFGNVGIDDVVGPTTDISVPRRRVRNLRDWLAENSGGRARIGEVRYYGCRDGNWYTPPAAHQGSYYWDNMAWGEMFADALNAADPDVDFHAYDADGDNKLKLDDEVLVVCMRPQNSAYGTARGRTLRLDDRDPPLEVPILDLYLSPQPNEHIRAVGVAAHELSHFLLERNFESYGNCPDIDPGFYSVLDTPGTYAANHLDPHSKLKLGWVQPIAINLDTLTAATAFNLPAVETHHRVLLLHDNSRLEREYFLIENRFPGVGANKNYDAPLMVGSIAIWQVFEDRQLVDNAAVCQGDPRYIRFRGALRTPGQSRALNWGNGSPTGWRIVADAADGPDAHFRLVKTESPLPVVSRPTVNSQ